MPKLYRIGFVGNDETEAVFEPFSCLMGRVKIEIDDLLIDSDRAIDLAVKRMAEDLRQQWAKNGHRLVELTSANDI